MGSGDQIVLMGGEKKKKHIAGVRNMGLAVLVLT